MKVLVWYGPLLKVVASEVAAFGLILVYHYQQYSSLDSVLWQFVWGSFFLGIFYTHIFEYLYHRFALHYGIPGLKWIKDSHTEHHRVFHRQNYKTKNPADLWEISSSWYLFPILLFIHYFAFISLLPNKYASFAPIFFLG